MQITGHNIEIYSQWNKEVSYFREEKLKTSKIRVLAPGVNNQDQINITPESQKLLDEITGELNSVENVKNGDKYYISLSEEDLQKIKVLEEFISKLTGKEFKIKIPYYLKKGSGKQTQTQQAQVATRESWQIEYNLNQSYKESEKLNFSSQGIVKTADGKQIDFSVKLNLSREFAVEHNLNLKLSGGQPVDPLVINYSGKAASFKQTTFEFDLTTDGYKENIPQLNQGSGYLVRVDKEEKIKDGSQLFGPTTGDGFKELAAHDHDNNGWIDSNDSIFDNLNIWTKDAEGNDRLFALGDKNLGAIYLGKVKAPYSHKGAANQTLAINKQLSLYLGENGETGIVQEVDLVV